MQVTRLAPNARLAPFVHGFTIIETGETVTRALLPERGIVIGVRFAGAAHLVVDGVAARVGNTSITGIQGTIRNMRTAAGSGIVLAVFRPAGAMRFFRAPLHELFCRTGTLEDLAPRADLARLEAQIGEARGTAERVAHLERFLLARLCPDADPVVEAAVRAIGAAHGAVRIAQLARGLGISQDPLEKRFRRAVGASPKQLASLLRLRRVIDGRDSPTGSAAEWRRGSIDARGAAASWSARAIAAGYFDQSHFIREFRAMTGQAPTEFFRSGRYCGSAEPGARAPTGIAL